MFDQGCRLVKVLCNLIACCLMCGARTEAAITISKNVATNLLQMEDVSDVSVSAALVFLGYSFQYIASAGFFELTHPYGILSSKLNKEQLAKRRSQVSCKTQSSGTCDP